MKPLTLPLFVACSIGVQAQTNLIDASFDGVANDLNNTFGIISNAPADGSGAAWNQTTGLVNRGTASNSTAGAVSTTTIDIPALGTAPVVLTVAVASGTGSLSANGLFVGFQAADGGANAGEELWNNLAPAFGVVIDGGSRLGAYVVAPGGNNGTAFQDAPSFGTTTSASINDGFTVTLSVDDTGWRITLTGLQTGGGTAITGGSGTWADVPFNFSDFTSGMRVAFTTQGSGGGSLDLSSVSVLVDGDTDSDQMPDSWEDAHGLDKNNGADAALDNDSNGGADGLTNLQEFQNGTDPQDSDSDNDGLNDGDEVNGTLNPWTSGIFGSAPGDPTNPIDDDSDDDGDKDGVEITNGTDPNAKPPNTGPLFPFVDTDGDSYSDIAEAAFGSNPNDSTDCPDHTPNAAKPNVVIIYADDMGLGDMSAYGTLFGTLSPVATPHMNSLADEGVLFTQAHSANAVCSPSRYSVLTGKYNWREFDGITSHYGGQKGGLEVPRQSDTTLAEFLKPLGYDTAAFGKWHLGGAFYTTAGARIAGGSNPTTPASIDWARPVEHHAVANGFDTFRGLATTINFGPYVYLEDDRVQYWDPSLNGGAGDFRNATNSDPFKWLTAADLRRGVPSGYDQRESLGDPSYSQGNGTVLEGPGPIMINQVEDYFATRAAANDPDPFFAYVSLYSPHQPWATTPAFIGGGDGFAYSDWMREVDDRIGRVIAAIDDNGYHNNTIVILTSDNGTENLAMSQSIANGRDPNGPLRGNKRDVWDGGTRVPFVVRWPGQAAAGMKIGDLIWQGDIFATVAAFLNQELSNSVAPDGESFLNLIRGQQKPAPHREGIVVSSIRRDLGLKTVSGWKFIDATGGGDSTSWDSSNNTIPSAAGTNKGVPKQLFHHSIDLGEDHNLISSLTATTAIRNELVSLTGKDLLDSLDQHRTATTSVLYPRVPDNDADLLPNSFEMTYGLDPNSPKDAAADADGDQSSNYDEYVAGTDPINANDKFKVASVQDEPDDITVNWLSKLDRSYKVQWSLNLVDWHDGLTYQGTGGQLSSVLSKPAIDADDGVTGNLTRIFIHVEVFMP